MSSLQRKCGRRNTYLLLLRVKQETRARVSKYSWLQEEKPREYFFCEVKVDWNLIKCNPKSVVITVFPQGFKFRGNVPALFISLLLIIFREKTCRQRPRWAAAPRPLPPRVGRRSRSSAWTWTSSSGTRGRNGSWSSTTCSSTPAASPRAASATCAWTLPRWTHKLLPLGDRPPCTVRRGRGQGAAPSTRPSTVTGRKTLTMFGVRTWNC